jgi:NO-binding membrane sensor protein with MHYT domain
LTVQTPRGGRSAPKPVEYDGTHKLLAFLGAVAFVMAALFWALLGVRLSASGLPIVAGCGLCAIASGLFLLPAWGARMKMQDEAAITRWEVRRLLLGGLVLGVAIGALPYLVLRFKLEDPDFAHIASESANLPPALR